MKRFELSTLSLARDALPLSYIRNRKRTEARFFPIMHYRVPFVKPSADSGTDRRDEPLKMGRGEGGGGSRAKKGWGGEGGGGVI